MGIIFRGTPHIHTISLMPQWVVVAICPLRINLIVIRTIMSITSKKIRTMTNIMGHLLLPRLHMDTRPIRDIISVNIPIIGPSMCRRPPIIMLCHHNDSPAPEENGGGISTRSTRRLLPHPAKAAFQRPAYIIIHQFIHNFLIFAVLPLQLGWTAGIHPLGAGPMRTTTH